MVLTSLDLGVTAWVKVSWVRSNDLTETSACPFLRNSLVAPADDAFAVSRGFAEGIVLSTCLK